ncbi:MAG: hypothetical protein AVO39_09595, partial [delta proteobacterium MLS_D]
MMKKREGARLSMLCDMSEIASLLVGSENLENFLQRTVVMVAEHLDVPVCSIYMYDEKNRELVLKATTGLNPQAVNRVRMNLGEGLVGTVMKTYEPILEASCRKNPHFKYIAEIFEEGFESFLAVPIGRGRERIGVLTVQHTIPDYFTELDVTALRGIAAQLAGVTANARLLMSLDIQPVPQVTEDLYERLSFVAGKSASGGYAFGLSTILDPAQIEVTEESVGIHNDVSVSDFRRALARTAEQLEDLQNRLSKKLPEAASLIFAAHHMILKDEGFSQRVAGQMEEGVAAGEAVRNASNYYIRMFASSSRDALREKALDVEDLALRIIANLRPSSNHHDGPVAGRVVITDRLYPSDILRLAAEEVRGAVLVGGGITSHVAILSRSLQFPLVICDEMELLNLPRGTPLLLDADMGNIYVNPSRETVARFEQRNKTKRSLKSLAKSVTDTTATRDGTRIRLMANINILGELEIARSLKAEGVGLYRTEFPFLIRSSYPSEEEQYRIYRRMFEEMKGKPVVVRTLDLAGDKVLPYAESIKEDNPQLGLRSLRFLFEYRDVFEQQIRAILRAADGAENAAILFPLVSSLDEFREARQCVFECRDRLKELGIPHNDSPRLGAMIEIPAIVEIVDDIAEEVDFASIGTNDFVQYMLAADRGNDRVLRYYQPYHPAVLRALKKIVQSFERHGKEISLCGEQAHDMDYLSFLVGIGIRTLSVDPRCIPDVQRTLAEDTLEESVLHADSLLAEKT